MSEQPTAPLPVITTNLLEKRERGYLAWVAVANEVAELPLESPPIDASTHALEIHVEGYDQPLVVLADPMGAPTTQGFPLRLRPLDDDQENELRMELFSKSDTGPGAGAAKPPEHKISMVGIPAPAENAVSADHANALNRMTLGGGNTTTTSRRAPGALNGRSLGDGRFILDKLLGGGASGEVYKAVHTALRRPVAVKVLHTSLQQSEDYATRFYAEALAASRLDHRNVLRVIDYGQEPDGLLYIVMELITGKSFMDILIEEGPLSEARLVELVSQACAGLAHAHDAGVIHRDIKPENILVLKQRDDEGAESECVKVCDFGIAHWTPPSTGSMDEDRSLIKTPDASKIVGTPGYMAPEQIQNEAVDARTDVYALGVVMYELATGRLPFLSEDAMEILTCHMVETPAPPSIYRPDLPPRLERIIMRTLEKTQDDRPKDMRDLRAALRRLVDDDWSSPSGTFRKISIRETPLTAPDFLNDTANALGILHDIGEHDRAAGFTALSEALKTATLEGRTKLARDLVAWLQTRLADPGLPDVEKDLAQRASHVLREPEVARAHAVNLLDGKVERTEDTLLLLREAGPLAARALIDSRRVRPPGLELRARFVETLRAIGPSALPVIVSALEPLSALASRHDEAMAEDLLRALPDGRSDAAGDVTVRFVRLDKPTLGITALRATTALWGTRARPLLVGVLDSHDDQFRLVAVEELYRLGCIDDVVVERLGRIVLGQNQAGEELKVAAAQAFAASTADARTRATGILVSRLAPEKGLMSSIRSALGPRDDGRVVVALARALYVLDPAGSRGILERFAGGRPDVRPHIDAILAGR